MTPKGRDTVNDAPRFEVVPPETLLRLELWGDGACARLEDEFASPLPTINRAETLQGLRVIWREPSVWLVRGPRALRDELVARMGAAAGRDGAVFDVSGAAMRCRLRGPDWRILLTYGGVFDIENPTFSTGWVAGTLIEHFAVRIDVIDDCQADVYVAPSYASDLLDYWSRVAGTLDVTGR